MADEQESRLPTHEWREFQRLRAFGRDLTRCWACKGALEQGDILDFARIDDHVPRNSRDRTGAARPPAWADAMTPFAASLDRAANFHFLRACYPAQGGEHWHLELRRADPRYDDLLAFYILLEDEAYRRRMAGYSALWVYVRPCPHCGERDPAALADLMIAETELVRAMKEADDRPLLAYDESGQLIPQKTRHEQLMHALPPPVPLEPVGDPASACPECGKQRVQNARFCSNCGADHRKLAPLPAAPPPPPPPPPPKIAHLKPQPLMSCRACGQKLTPRAVFTIGYKSRNSGLVMDDDRSREHLDRLIEAREQGLPEPPPPPPPPDPWEGKNWVSAGGQPEEVARASLAADPDWQGRAVEVIEREVRRRAASHYLSTIPQSDGYWAPRIVRGLIRPCHACGEADPLGTADPPSPAG